VLEKKKKEIKIYFAGVGTLSYVKSKYRQKGAEHLPTD
jgi:hypothetical protein